jgi:LPS-assembly lipoprotein
MWWRRQSVARAAAVLAVLALAGCGFRPLHGAKSGAAAPNMAEISIVPIADRVGQQLHNLLLDKVTPGGPPARPRYVLKVTLNEARQNLAVRKDEVATRANLVMRAVFSLSRADDGASLMSGSALSANSYNILRSDFGTLSAENDARARAVNELSDQIKSRIGIYLSGQR